MKARLPASYRKQPKSTITREFTANLIRHICKGFIVVMYKKYGWRKKRCSELITEVIDYLNHQYDEAEVGDILAKLELDNLADATEM